MEARSEKEWGISCRRRGRMGGKEERREERGGVKKSWKWSEGRTGSYLMKGIRGTSFFPFYDEGKSRDWKRNEGWPEYERQTSRRNTTWERRGESKRSKLWRRVEWRKIVLGKKRMKIEAAGNLLGKKLRTGMQETERKEKKRKDRQETREEIEKNKARSQKGRKYWKKIICEGKKTGYEKCWWKAK